MAEARPPIPEAIKREVRQRCGFGCVICGMPIFHYDHIEEYAQEQKHEPANITLLCAKHHDQKTRGSIKKEDVKKADAKPHNAGRDTTSTGSWGFALGDKFHFTVGSLEFHTPIQGEVFIPVIMLDGAPALGVTRAGNELLLSAHLMNDDGDVILEIVQGELAVSTGQWDYDYVGATVTMRSAARNISLVITLEGNHVTAAVGTFIGPLGARLEIDPQGATLFAAAVPARLERNTYHGHCLYASVLTGITVAPLSPVGIVASPVTDLTARMFHERYGTSGQHPSQASVYKFLSAGLLPENDAVAIELARAASRIYSAHGQLTEYARLEYQCGLLLWRRFGRSGDQAALQSAEPHFRAALSVPERLYPPHNRSAAQMSLARVMIARGLTADSYREVNALLDAAEVIVKQRWDHTEIAAYQGSLNLLQQMREQASSQMETS